MIIELAKCEHKTSAVLADEGTVDISACTWGCGEILVTVTNDDGVSQVMTVKEIVRLRADNKLLRGEVSE